MRITEVLVVRKNEKALSEELNIFFVFPSKVSSIFFKEYMSIGADGKPQRIVIGIRRRTINIFFYPAHHLALVNTTSR